MDWLGWEPILKKELVAGMERAPDVSKAHGLDHIVRVWSRCLKLGIKLDADLEVLLAATYLHDLGRHYGLDIHGEKSAMLAGQILERINFPEKKVKKALDVIRLHDHHTPAGKRTQIEEQILYDADKLDSFGAVGVARFITYYYLREKSIEMIIEQVEKRYKDLHFKESRELAQESYQYTIDFFKKLRGDLRVE